MRSLRAVVSSTHARTSMILMAEDDEDDRELVRDAFRDAKVRCGLEFVNDGQDLLDYLRGAADYADRQQPAIILLDLNMPRMDGREALVEIRADDKLREIPVLVLSTSTDDADVHLSYRAGANSFISKPVTHAGLVEVIRRVRDYWLELVRLP
jgi:CheY-like chemotaxis protein